MAVDKSYGSGNKNTGMKKPVAPTAASAKLRKGGVKAAAKKYTSITTSKAKMLPGTSDYVAQENAARKQLGVAGLAARNRQLPAAARATARGLVREITGVDISRKGINVNPLGLAMALPVGKLLKVSKALRAAGQIDRALGVEARVAAKALGGSRKAKGLYPGKAFLGETGQAAANRARQSSEFVFPRAPKKGPMGQPDLGDLGAGRVGLPFNTPAQIRRANRARRATQAGDRVYELEKRLNLPRNRGGR